MLLPRLIPGAFFQRMQIAIRFEQLTEYTEGKDSHGQLAVDAADEARAVPNLICVGYAIGVENSRSFNDSEIIRAVQLLGTRDAASQIEELAPVNGHVMLLYN